MCICISAVTFVLAHSVEILGIGEKSLSLFVFQISPKEPKMVTCNVNSEYITMIVLVSYTDSLEIYGLAILFSQCPLSLSLTQAACIMDRG